MTIARKSRNPPVDSINLIDQFVKWYWYFLGGTENRNGIELYKTPICFTLSLDIKPGTGNPSNWYRQISVVSVST